MAEDKKMSRSEKRYSKTPTMERNEKGKMAVKKKEAKAPEAESAGGGDKEMAELMQKHAEERMKLHHAHETQMMTHMHSKAKMSHEEPKKESGEKEAKKIEGKE